MTLAEEIVGMFKEGLSAWKTYLSTRQEAYNRKMDKRKQRAIQEAETGFEKMNVVFDLIYRYAKFEDDGKEKEYLRAKELVIRQKERFNKFD